MTTIESLLNSDGPVAIIIRERLRPVGGMHTVVFPPTYAPDKDKGEKKSGYNLDDLTDGKRCVIDSVQSQANRMEPIFMEDSYKDLVPQVWVKAGDKQINLLEAAHRLADAAVRFSELSDQVDSAFNDYLKNGDATKIAKLSPMSIVFGAWDSRGTHAKIPRLLGSTIFADNVFSLTRSSQFNPSFNSDDVSGRAEDELKETEKQKWSVAGLAHAPAKGLGGVLVNDSIVREATVNLIVLRKLKGADEEGTEKLRKYILGLTLVCATLPQDYDLRSGCQLVLDGKDARTVKQIDRDGTDKDFSMTHNEALTYAKQAAENYGIEKERKVNFEKDKALNYLGEKKAKKASKSKKG